MGGINKAEQMLQDKLVRTVQQNNIDVRTLKSVQPVGADVLQTVGFPSAGAAAVGPFAIASGARGTFNIDFTPSSNTLTLWNILWTLYVDVENATNRFPNGSAMTTELLNVDLTPWIDWEQSSDTTNLRRFKLSIKNNGASSHDYYLSVRAYLPKIGVS